MARSTKEWIGKSDDHKAPSTVRDRVFERADRICHICKLAIKIPVETWDLDHVKALINGGENRESNLAPAHKHCHLAKTVLDVKEKAKVAKVKGKHNGSIRPAGKISGPPFPQTERAAKRAPKPSLPQRPLFKPAEDRT